MGLISAVYVIVVRVYLQTHPPPELRSRVFGWFAGIQGPLQIVSLMLAIFLANLWNAREILRGAAIGEMLTAVAGAFFLLRLRSALR